MMSAFYLDLQQMSAELLKEFDGRPMPMKIIRKFGGAVSSVTGQFVPGSVSQINLTGIVAPYSKGKKVPTAEQTGDIQAIIDYQVEPLPADLFEVDGKVYSVVSIAPVKPADIPLIYKVRLSR